ncbi:MAG: ABC transporter ATP-binding protein [Cytophagales bacterium]
MEFLEVRNLYKSYEGKIVIRNLSFQLAKGQRLCILGENGCGKSTLLKMIAGWENPDSGGIFLENKIVEGFGKKLVRGHKDIILLNQHYQLNNQITVFDNLLMALKHLSKAESLEITQQMVELFRLEPFKDKKPTELSGGQRQRSSMAQCFALSPKILLLDEPFSNQDHKQKELLISDLMKINQQWETTLIYVTHDAIDALAMSTETIVMESGKFIQRATPKALYNNPQSEYVAMLTGEYNLLNGKILDHYKLENNDDSIFYIRPEEIKINESGLWKAKVLEVLFCGYFTKLKVLILDTEMMVFDFENKGFEVNDEIKFNIEPSKIKRFET